ncbi:hypothetical protein GCM10025773_05560 [Microbacterium jejuense]
MRGPDAQDSADSGLSRAFSQETEEDRNEQDWPFGVARGWHAPTSLGRAGWLSSRNSDSPCHRARATACHIVYCAAGEIPDQKVFVGARDTEWHGVARLST